ncbi:unnamed protein product [Zymoseptoria tritici ST99CH_1E4]|uniref:C2H2-type domain-containing protein n=2 Tax=Zymoseptoria tritici TaxID=1047171 RepID=A0A2H1GHQ1_ZYMTR|nr:unnamed protein product [Zymoseptoria tritici ST99CH_1E4]
MTIMSTKVPKVEAGPSNGERPADQSSGGGDDDAENNNDAEHEVVTSKEDNPKKKRRKTVKIPDKDKKYQCAQPHCGKRYSRAEHLSRHNLNHMPKQMYYCEHPGCKREFVRADLRARHQDRHTQIGSHLQRKEEFRNRSANQDESASPTLSASTATTSPVEVKQQTFTPSAEQYTLLPASKQRRSLHASTGASREQRRPATSSDMSRSGSQSTSASRTQPSSPPTSRRFSVHEQYSNTASMSSNGYDRSHQLPVASMNPPLVPQSQPTGPVYPQSSYPASQNGHYATILNYPMQSSMPSLLEWQPSPSYSASASSMSVNNTMSPQSMDPMNQYGGQGGFAAPSAGNLDFERYISAARLPLFSDGSLGDDWTYDQLFASLSTVLDDPSPPHQDMYYEPRPLVSASNFTASGAAADSKPSIPPMTGDQKSTYFVGMNLGMREAQFSETAQAGIIALIQSFQEPKDLDQRRIKESLLHGDTANPNHVLSVNIMKTCLASYWVHIHQQMPILHRPTFVAETCPDILLLVLICLGACCLERTHPPETNRACTELAFFSARHIRWEIFTDPDFEPPAKLWTFQTMLLLELFEKMYSSRRLHERSHIHHATTLNAMRRGSSLVGRCVNGEENPTRTPPGPGGTINTSGTNTEDPHWNWWITSEATRRAAFAAFVIDSTHASLYGHAAVMNHNDIRTLPLPCNETLWAAPSMADVQKFEASHAENGFKPINFLEGLRLTLGGSRVHTNVFGRTILMAGLLNVSLHVKQYALLTGLLGHNPSNNTSGNQSPVVAKNWPFVVTKAFGHWKTDFDRSMPKTQGQGLQISEAQNNTACHPDHHDNVFESGSCLETLAHMATHVDLVDCEAFAGAKYTLSRFVTVSDRAVLENKMRAWAPQARARDAAFYALRFLAEVLIPVKQELDADVPTFTYSARDDYLLNRPWILYFAVMVVWSYGYALDGPLKDKSVLATLNTREAQIRDMQSFLRRATAYTKPDDLEHNWKDRNAYLGLLILMRECLMQSRWELLHEASSMLGMCIDKSMPRDEDGKAAAV